MRCVLILLFLAACLAFSCSSGLKHINPATTSEGSWRPLGGSALAALQPAALTQPVEPAIKPVDVGGSYVAVFDIADKTHRLSSTELDGLSEYLATKIAEGGLFHVVPRDEIKSRLREQQKQSYKECYEQSCQIEIGREIAAQKTLSVSISAVGSSCIVTAALFDLKKSATDATATNRGGCKSDDLLVQIEEIISKLRKMAK
jgi:hypothetical protein